MTIKNYHGIKIDYSRDERMSEVGLNLVTGYYLKKGETSPQEAYARTAINFCAGDMKLAQRIYDYVSKGWMSFASPLLSNSVMGKWVDGEYLHTEKVRAMPISCFLQYVPDTLNGQIEAASELASLSCAGGGVGSYMGMRGITGKSPGSIPYIKTQDSNIMYYHQSGTRRGSIASYLDINHPDIVEFIGIRNPSGGDINRKAHNVNIAVNVDYAFIEACNNDESWDLICPNTKEVIETLPSARALWEQIIETRFKTGEPYIHNVEESNIRMPQAQKDKGLSIKSSNLCLVGSTEITIAEDAEGSNSKTITLEQFNDMFSMGFYEEVFVQSYNVETKSLEFCLIEDSGMTGVVNELIQITDGNFSIECTPDHKVLTTNRGYVMAKDILETDSLVKLSDAK